MYIKCLLLLIYYSAEILQGGEKSEFYRKKTKVWHKCHFQCSFEKYIILQGGKVQNSAGEKCNSETDIKGIR